MLLITVEMPFISNRAVQLTGNWQAPPLQKLSDCSRIASASQPAMEYRSERSLADLATDARTEKLGRTGVEKVGGGLQSVPRIISARPA